MKIMITLIEKHREQLERLCQAYHVKRLELFGSAKAEQSFNALSSDIDFLVEFLPLAPGRRADAFFGLREALETLFGRPIDLIVSGAIKNPYFRQAVDKDRELLYAA